MVTRRRVLPIQLRTLTTTLVALMLCMFGSVNAMAPQRAAIKPTNSAAATSAVSPHAQLMRFLMQPVEDPDQLRGYRVAILAADGVDGFDLEVPRSFLADRGALVHRIVSRSAEHLDEGASSAPHAAKTSIVVIEPSGERRSESSGRFIDQVQSCEYDLLYLPATRAISPESARVDPLIIAFVQRFAREGKPIFASGNGVLVLVEAGLLDGRAAPVDGGMWLPCCCDARSKKYGKDPAYTTHGAYVGLDRPLPPVCSHDQPSNIARSLLLERLEMSVLWSDSSLDMRIVIYCHIHKR